MLETKFRTCCLWFHWDLQLCQYSTLMIFSLPSLHRERRKILPRKSRIRKIRFFQPISTEFLQNRVFIHICCSHFVLQLYYNIFKFRQKLDKSIQGECSTSFKCNLKSNAYYTGISDKDRKKRKQKNRISTQLNFLAWLL